MADNDCVTIDSAELKKLQHRSEVLDAMMIRLHMYRRITMDNEGIKRILDAIDAWDLACQRDDDSKDKAFENLTNVVL